MSMIASGAGPLLQRASAMPATKREREFPSRRRVPAAMRDDESLLLCSGAFRLHSGDRPHEAHELARDCGNGDGAAFAACHQGTIALCEAGLRLPGCQSALERAPLSAPKRDPSDAVFFGCRIVAEPKAEQRSDSRWRFSRDDQARFLKRQLSLPVSTMSQ